MGKLGICPQGIFYPKLILSGYNVYASGFLNAKSLIFWTLTDLSTKNGAFTITTIFIYTSYLKQLYSTSQWIFQPARLKNRQITPKTSEQGHESD